MRLTTIRFLSLGLVLLGTAGCRSVGPRTINRDRLDYGDSIADSWKRQILGNIVRLRYFDLPVFMDVSQVVAGYSLETGVSIAGQVAPPGRGDTFGGIGASGKFTDRPTITYTPLTGEKFLRGVITPVPPRTLFYLIEAGYSAEFLLGLGLENINGLRNRSLRDGVLRPADPGFLRAIELFGRVQSSGAVSMRVLDRGVAGTTTVVFFRADQVADEVLAQVRELKELLGLAPDAVQYELVFAPSRTGPTEIAAGSRSILQMLGALATFVEVPAVHIEEKRVRAMAMRSEGEQSPIRIRSSPVRPKDAFTAIEYRGQWFYVADDDWSSKRTLSTILFLFTLNDLGTAENLPLLTIPAS